MIGILDRRVLQENNKIGKQHLCIFTHHSQYRLPIHTWFVLIRDHLTGIPKKLLTVTYAIKAVILRIFKNENVSVLEIGIFDSVRFEHYHPS